MDPHSREGKRLIMKAIRRGTVAEDPSLKPATALHARRLARLMPVPVVVAVLNLFVLVLWLQDGYNERDALPVISAVIVLITMLLLTFQLVRARQAERANSSTDLSS